MCVAGEIYKQDAGRWKSRQVELESLEKLDPRKKRRDFMLRVDKKLMKSSLQKRAQL